MVVRIVICLLTILFCLSSSVLASNLNIDLNDAEKLWLANHSRISIGVMDDWPPLNFIGSDGKPQGVGADYIAAINKLLDGAIVIQPAPFKENYERVQNGQLDALMDITSKPERETLFHFTKPYISIPHAIVGRKDGPYFDSEEDLAGRTVALERGFYNITYFRKHHPTVTIREYTSTSDALDAVARGEADAHAGNRAVAIHLIEKDFHNNLRLMGKLTNAVSVLQFGISKNEPLLASILDKALRALPESEHSAIYAKWVGLKYKQGLDYALFWKIMAGSLAVIALIVYWNLRLGREVSVRKQAEAELMLYKDHLEELIMDRSAELEQKNHALAKEIIERQHDLEALAYSNECFSQALNSPQHVLYRLNVKKGCYDYLSPAFEQITGYPHAEFKNTSLEKLKEYFHPDDRIRIFSMIEEAFRSRTGNTVNFEFEYRLRKAAGDYCWLYDSCTACFDDNGELECFFGSAHDITDRIELQQEREKAQKLESLGVMAGGIAHDFNNILTGIMGNISLIKSQIGPDSKVTGRLAICETACRRATNLTHQLLTFAKGGGPQKMALDVSDIVQESLSLALRGSNVKGELEIPPDTWHINADKGQISQVFNNLLINARQAMPSGGVVKIRASNVTLEKHNVQQLPTGQYVNINVADTGCGIPEQFIEKIFDPYFTTKEGGTGLGLASVYSIVKRHGGCVAVRSTEGKGTEFLIHLQAILKKPLTLDEEVKYPSQMKAGGGKILVMDDEDIIRELANMMLQELGYMSSVCGDGREAVALYRDALEKGAPFDAVILDLTVPGGMGGKEAARLIGDIDKGANLIVSSGYSNDAVFSDFKAFGFCGSVMKPYSLETLQDTLTTVVDGRQHNPKDAVISHDRRAW